MSGSGKSSLAFDTIYAEGQRRYVESLSAYARQFLEQMGKPDVDSIDGLSPAIAIEQKSGSRNPRSQRRHHHRDLRLPAPAVGARRRRRVLPLRQADRRRIPSSRWSTPSWRCPTARGSRCWRRSSATRRATSRPSSGACARTATCAPTSTASWPSWPSRRRWIPDKRHTIEVFIDRLVQKDGIRQRLTDSHRAGGQAGRRPGEGLAAGGRRHPVLREVRLPHLRHHLPGDRAPAVLVQQPGRRLPVVRRHRGQDVLRSRSDRRRSATCRCARAPSSPGSGATPASSSRCWRRWPRTSRWT